MRYTYVLNNPLKYTDPSGYTYYWKRYVWQREVTESMNFNSGGGGVSRRDIHSYFDYINSMHSDPRGWSYNESTEEFYNGRTGEVIDANNPAAAFYYMGVDFRYIDVPKTLKRIEKELEKAISEVYFNHLLSQNGGLGTGGMSFDGDPKNIDWDMVLSGAITTTGGTLMMIGGGIALATGVGAPAGGVALTFGAPTFGFGLAKLIDGFQGGDQDLPSGFFEATGEGLGGDGSFGQVVDIVVGGIPRNSVSAIITGYSIGNLDYFQNIQQGATYYSPNNNLAPNYEIALRDNTYNSLPIIY